MDSAFSDSLLSGPRSALTEHSSARNAAEDLANQLGLDAPRIVFFFCSWKHDGVALSEAFRERWPETHVVGCTTAGAFNQDGDSSDGVSAFALGPDIVKRCAVALADYGDDAPTSVAGAMESLGNDLGLDMHTATPDRYVGVVLQDGLGGEEEAVNHALGVAAPTVPFIGGSAGDAIRFEETPVFVDGKRSGRGAALVLLDMAAPFTILKTESVEPTGKTLTVTKVSRLDGGARIVDAFDGRPAAEAYAEATGIETNPITTAEFLEYPLGWMEGDRVWLRSPAQHMENGGLRFLSKLDEGMQYHVMRQSDLVATTRADLDVAVSNIGVPLKGALVFNCVYRRLEMDAVGLHADHRALYEGIEAAGFHTYGETFLGHVNQTGVMLLVG